VSAAQRRGRFITLEGGEGAGKSTQSRALASALSERGIPVVRTREPGGAPGAEHLRTLLLSGEVSWSPLAETMLHYAARAEHIARTIAPALTSGAWVVCDRFYDSTMADVTIILDVSVETSLVRLKARGTAADRYERLGTTFFAAVRAGFHDIAASEPDRCVLIDAEDGEAHVAKAVLAAVDARLAAP
jgi:dTMP kinase